MKTVKIIFSIIFALALVAAMGVFIFFQIFDTDHFIPQITGKISVALGRPVSIGHLGLGLSSRGITLDAGPLFVTDEPGFTSQPSIKIDRIRIRPDLGELVLHQRIHVREIILQSLEVHIIRAHDGSLNISSLGKNTRPMDLHPQKGHSGGPLPNRTGNKVEKNNAVSPVRVVIQDAAISYIDQTQGSPLDIWLTGINASLDDISFAKPLRVAFDSCLLCIEPNVRGSALLSWDPVNRTLQASQLSLHFDLTRLDIDRLESSDVLIKDNPLLKDITGMVQLDLPQLEINPSGVIEANGEIIITDAVLKGFNIIKVVLSRTLGIFGGMDKLIDQLGVNDTVIEKAQAKFDYHDKTFFIDDSTVRTNIFQITAQGSIDQGLNTDLQTMLYVNPDVTANLVNKLGGLRILCDSSDRIAVGAALQGVIPRLKYKPNKDFRKKTKRFLMEEGGNILGVLFGGR